MRPPPATHHLVEGGLTSAVNPGGDDRDDREEADTAERDEAEEHGDAGDEEPELLRPLAGRDERVGRRRTQSTTA